MPSVPLPFLSFRSVRGGPQRASASSCCFLNLNFGGGCDFDYGYWSYPLWKSYCTQLSESFASMHKTRKRQ